MSDWHFRFFVVGCVIVLVVYGLISVNTSKLDLNGNMTGTLKSCFFSGRLHLDSSGG